MALTMIIPDDMLGEIKLPGHQIETELKKEIAFTLYARGLTSMGVARRFANLDKWEFIQGLAERGINRHYYEKEAEDDIKYARRCE